MRRHAKRLILKFICTMAIASIFFYSLFKTIDKAMFNHDDILDKIDVSNLIRIDWHDSFAMAVDRLKMGLGEQGKPAYLPKNESEKIKKLFEQNGFNAHLSDHISLFRSVPDIRNEKCNDIFYINQLPHASIIIIFYNEHWSTLLRTIYSILNRSPVHLIYEIILVDDGSEKEFLGKKLDNYVANNLPKVKIIRHNKRLGLITARLTGAESAKGKILVFLDSHIEANYNWLPPLLEPIAHNPKIVVCPFIDVIDHDNFQYRAQDEGARGGFDWEFHYKRLPLMSDDLKNSTKPFENPVMAGGLFAINRKWFWALGGYDPELDIWGGEQYELSFKIWMCGGALLDVPCSRVGHVYRGKINSSNPDFVNRNYKRVAEVWMDEYAKILYDRDRSAFDAVDAGNLSDRRAIRKRLKCKPFKWFMENVAFDTLKYYPMVEPPSYAYGAIRSMADETLCLDSLNHGEDEEPGLYPCTTESINGHPQGNQNWQLSWHKDLKLHKGDLCLDVQNHRPNGKIIFYPCHDGQGNQCWFYDYDKKFLVQGVSGYCLEANIKNLTVHINKCYDKYVNMKWEFGFYNVTGLRTFYTNLPNL